MITIMERLVSRSYCVSGRRRAELMKNQPTDLPEKQPLYVRAEKKKFLHCQRSTGSSLMRSYFNFGL